jgi:FixJ family two-component response regulator
MKQRQQPPTCLGEKRQDIRVPLICVVDDNESVLAAVIGLIESAGYQTKGFCSSEDCLAWRQLPQAACLVVDLMMTSISGLELQRLLTARQYRIPIIFITAYDDEDIRVRALQAGAAGFLLKPFSDDSLFAAIRSALAKPPPEQ